MIWLRLIGWVIGRGLVGGAVFGALLGILIAFIYGAALGLFVGGVFGAAMGFVNGILLAEITWLAYAPPSSRSYYPKLVYSVAIITNTVPIFTVFGGLMLSWAVMPLTLSQSITSLMCSGGIPALIIGVITAYFAGGFLEYADALTTQTPSRQSSVNVLS